MINQFMQIKLAAKDPWLAARAVPDEDLEVYIKCIEMNRVMAFRRWVNPARKAEMVALTKASHHETMIDWMLASYNSMNWMERFHAALKQEYIERNELTGAAAIEVIRQKNRVLCTIMRDAGQLPHVVHKREIIEEDDPLDPWAIREYQPHWTAAGWCKFVKRPIPPRRRRRRRTEEVNRPSRAQMRIEMELEKYPVYMRAKAREKLERKERLRPKIKIRCL